MKTNHENYHESNAHTAKERNFQLNSLLHLGQVPDSTSEWSFRGFA